MSELDWTHADDAELVRSAVSMIKAYATGEASAEQVAAQLWPYERLCAILEAGVEHVAPPMPGAAYTPSRTK